MIFKSDVVEQEKDRKSKDSRDPHPVTSRQWPQPQSDSNLPSRQAFSPPSAAPTGLSMRAENVLKELAVELNCGIPRRGKWQPPDLLVERLTYSHLETARNCGPQTTTEIIAWAKTRGKDIRRSPHAGKSLSVMWSDIVARFSKGEITHPEIAEALERSTRRRNTRIPLDIQKMLLKIIGSSRR